MKSATARIRMRGAAAIEFALVFLAVWFVVLSCWVAGNIALKRSLVKEAARDAARMVANAASSELASADDLDLLEERAEQLLEDAIGRAGVQAGSIDIDRTNHTATYAPSLRVVRVSGEALITEQVFAYPIEHTVQINVEVPHGSRLAAP